MTCVEPEARCSKTAGSAAIDTTVLTTDEAAQAIVDALIP